MQAVIIPELQQELNELAKIYAKKFEARTRSVLEQRKFMASGDLAKSIKARVQTATATAPPEIVMEFAEHGDFIGKRRLIYTKIPPPDKILEWIRSGKFRPRAVPGYASGSVPNISEAQQQKRIAFAIATHKKKEQTHKSRRWKREALPALLREMNDHIVQVWAEKTAEILAKELTTDGNKR